MRVVVVLPFVPETSTTPSGSCANVRDRNCGSMRSTILPGNALPPPCAKRVFLVHRPDAYDKEDRPGEADIIMAKHRNGPTDTFNLAFLGAYSKFKDMPQDYQSQQEAV